MIRHFFLMKKQARRKLEDYPADKKEKEENAEIIIGGKLRRDRFTQQPLSVATLHVLFYRIIQERGERGKA